jgi:hypothetical protein
MNTPSRAAELDEDGSQFNSGNVAASVWADSVHLESIRTTASVG